MIQRDFDGNVRVDVKRNVVWAAVLSRQVPAKPLTAALAC